MTKKLQAENDRLRRILTATQAGEAEEINKRLALERERDPEELNAGTALDIGFQALDLRPGGSLVREMGDGTYLFVHKSPKEPNAKEWIEATAAALRERYEAACPRESGGEKGASG